MTDTRPEDAPRRGSQALYDARAARHRAAADALGARSRLVSNLRGLAFVVFAVSGFAATFGGNAPSGPLSVVAFLVFLGLVIFHAKIIREEDAENRALRVNLDASARTTLAWRELPSDGSRFVSEHPYASDLDLFGKGSVYQRLSVAHTRFGEEALARFLNSPATIDVIRKRQDAARALAPRLDDRQALQALALAVVEEPSPLGKRGPFRNQKKPEPPDPEPLLAWTEGEPWLAKRPLLTGLSFVLPPLTLSAIAFGSALHLPAWDWLVPFIASLLVVSATSGEANRVFGAVSATEGAFLRFAPMFARIEALEQSSELLESIRQDLLAGGEPPSRAMKRFERAVGWFELKHNGMLHLFANVFLLWDVHCLRMLEAFQGASGKRVRKWFLALGEVEALSSFAGLSFDEPSFAWPELVPDGACYEATALGHLLLAPSARVTNDVSLSEAGRALLITGSNMSGKSTLLRSMGLSAVLAFAGAPVPAMRLRLSPLAVRTSIRISDSLSQGVSHFYAEVARLKAVVDATAGSLPVLFLLDEILHGTNSDERQVGARWVMGELIRRGALGAVSTHDVGLCQLPEPLMSRVVQCHFRESVADGRMTFDYRLRPGPVSGGNALRLMRLVGLDVPLDASPS